MEAWIQTRKITKLLPDGKNHVNLNVKQMHQTSTQLRNKSLSLRTPAPQAWPPPRPTAVVAGMPRQPDAHGVAASHEDPRGRCSP